MFWGCALAGHYLDQASVMDPLREGSDYVGHVLSGAGMVDALIW